jgi:hypothetical protein
VKRLSIKISPDGSIQAETHGVKGKECLYYIQVLEEILEAETVDSAYTLEYYEVEEKSTESVRQRQRLEEGG